VAEVRSFVVRTPLRGRGVSGRLLIDQLRERARTRGFEQLCAFTHAPAYFARLGFASVPHTSVPEKIAADCRRCSLFGTCGQYAMVTALAPAAASRAAASFLPLL
jgi:N-acetylglutamate synthase-like GNAT family acetyltransferase